MDGDVGGVQGGHRVQGTPEAVKIIRGKTGNQIHIDGGKARFFRLTVGSNYVCPGVRSAAGPEDGILHGLGVDAHPVGSVLPDSPKLFQIQGVRSASLHGEFDTPGEIEGFPEGIQQMNHLGSGQNGGGAAADVKGEKMLPAFLHQPGGDLNLPLQSGKVLVQQLGFFADGAADEAAIAAPGGAEGNAHIDGQVILVHERYGLDRRH